jgi:hypothetical protein
MAILYVLKIDDPNDVGPFPPSVLFSEWFTRIVNYFNKRGIISGANFAILDTTEEFNSWVSEFRIKDSVLIGDIESWKFFHNVSYSHHYYSLPVDNNSYPTILD